MLIGAHRQLQGALEASSRIKELVAAMRKRAHIMYSGMVQGVGFRWTARETAHDLAVSGWVRNLRDGSVEIEAEADEEVLEYFMRQIKKHFSSYIRKVTIEWIPPSGDTGDFTVSFKDAGG